VIRVLIALFGTALVALPVVASVQTPASATVMGTIQGTITLDGGGFAQNGCAVAWTVPSSTFYQDCAVASGAYSIDAPPGNYIVGFQGFTGAAYQYYPNTQDYAAATPVAVTGGGTLVIDAVLPLLGSIHGTVTQVGGAPATGGNARVVSSDLVSSWATGVDSGGHWSVTGLQPGSYYVNFDQFPWLAGEWYPNASSSGTATLVVVGSGVDVAIDAQLAGAGRILGTVSKDSGGPAVNGAVTAYDADGVQRGSIYSSDGTYTLDSLAPGAYTLWFQGFDGTFDEVYNNVASVALGTPVSVAAGVTTTGINVSLPDAALPTVDSVSPSLGLFAGGTPVTITGSGFSNASAVSFDGVAGTNLTLVSNTTLEVWTPAGTNAAANVIVTNPIGDSSVTAGAHFEYLDTNVLAETPTRIQDVSSFTSGVVRCYAVAGHAGVPIGATGVLLNVTAVGPSGNGYVVVYPDTAGNGATPAPLASTVNFEPGKDVANSAIVALPSDGKVCAFSAGGTLSRLILDVAGYVVPGSGVTMQSAQRLLDTRQAAQQVTGPVAPNVVNTVQVTGNAGVPAGATAVVANVTVVGPTAEGHLRAWAAGTAVPNTSVVNYAPGQTKANGQIIALSPSGGLSFESFTGTGTATNPVQVIIDVVGYVAAGSQFTATAPTRIVETRASAGIVGPIPGALVPNTVYPVTLTDTTLVPADATAVVLNVTAVGPTEFGNLRVYPDTNGLGTTTPPLASNLNYIPGRAIPNMVIVQIPPDRKIDFYNNQGASSSRTDLIVDVIGYIAAPTI
jgi:hypothetical protein